MCGIVGFFEREATWKGEDRNDEPKNASSGADNVSFPTAVKLVETVDSALDSRSKPND